MRGDKQVAQMRLQGVAGFVAEESGSLAAGLAMLFDGAKRLLQRAGVFGNEDAFWLCVRAPTNAVTQENAVGGRRRVISNRRGSASFAIRKMLVADSRRLDVRATRRVFAIRI